MAMSLLPLREARPLDFTPREGCRSYGYVLKTSRNLFLGIQVAELQKYSQVNFMAAIAALVYMAVEITLLLLHCLRVRNFYTGGDPDAWEHVFHMLEFWAAALFNVVTGVVLLNSTSASFHELAHQWPILIKRVALLNIVTAFVAALLIAIDLKHFEPLSHRIEYVVTIMMILVDYVLWLGLLKPGSSMLKPTAFQKVCFALSMAVGIAMNVIYNACPPPYNEIYVHFLEFPAEIIAGGVIFYSAVESKRKADLEIFGLMYSECKEPHSQDAYSAL